MKTLVNFGIPYCIREVPDPGNWLAATSYKPTFIHDMMQEHPSTPLVYLDADSRVRQSPILFDELANRGIDFAAHWRGGRELLSGTLFIGPGSRSRRLVDDWIIECANCPAVWDQKCLQTVVEHKSDANIVRLPPEYTAIFDARMCESPVIEHMQASRRLKR